MNNSIQIRPLSDFLYNFPGVPDALLSKISNVGYKPIPQVDISILKEYVTAGVYILIQEKFEKKVIQRNSLEILLKKYDGVYIKDGGGEFFYKKKNNRIHVETLIAGKYFLYFLDDLYNGIFFEHKYDDIIYMKIA